MSQQRVNKLLVGCVTTYVCQQVGKDTDAQAFLGRLDNDRDVGGMVDATSYFELEAEEYQRRGVVLTPELWMVKLMVGAIDPTYDEQVRGGYAIDLFASSWLTALFRSFCCSNGVIWFACGKLCPLCCAWCLTV